MVIGRRQFMLSSVGAAATLPLLSQNSGAAPDNPKPKIGIQLYAVRYEFDKNVPHTIQNLADIGYQGVEFYGYGGTKNVFKNWSAQQLRQLLDAFGIQCCGMHLNLNAFSKKNLATTVENNKILGNKYLVVAAAGNMMHEKDTIKKFADILNDTAEKVKSEGMKVGYHCHGFDFKEMGGSTAWDMLFNQVSPEVVMQLDTGNCAGGGGDPVAILKKFPGRTDSLHVKEWDAAPLKVGDSTWKQILHLCKTLHQTEWYTIEQGEHQGKGFAVAKESYETLRKML